MYVFIYIQIIIVCLCSSVFVYSLDMTPAEVASLLGNENYEKAVRIMETQIKKSNVKKDQKGHYAFLLYQLPSRVSVSQKRYEYAYMAVRWSGQLSQKEKLNLWIVAGDGLFGDGLIKRAELCYKSALNIINKLDNKKQKSYVQYKQAWVYVNQKKWKDSFRLLIQSFREGSGSLENNILFDIGKVWAESQYFTGSVSTKRLSQFFETCSDRNKVIVVNGIINGLQRNARKNPKDFIVAILKNGSISTRVFNNFISSEKMVSLFKPCDLLLWFKQSNVGTLKASHVFPVLNACSKALLTDKKNSIKKQALKDVAYLYEQLIKKGAQHWPLSLVYERLGLKKQSCEEISFYMLDSLQEMKQKNIKKENIEKVVSETLRLCKKTNISQSKSNALLFGILSSSELANLYQQENEGQFEKYLFNLLNLKYFQNSIKKYILGAHRAWGRNNLLVELIISNEALFNKREIKRFLDRFSNQPIQSFYMPLLLIIDPEVIVLQKWAPLHLVHTYDYLKPWLKKILSDELDNSEKRLVVKKLIKYFPNNQVDSDQAARFLGFYYLQKKYTSEIFNHWSKVEKVFQKKDLAKKLVEQSLSNDSSSCRSLSSTYSMEQVKKIPVLKFIYQSCELLDSQVSVLLPVLQMPAVLRSSPLAWDFFLLNRLHRQTFYLKKNLSQIQHKTAKMIMDLKKMVMNCQNRSWRLEKMRKKSRNLLNTQIDLFEQELTKLASSSTFGNKYNELVMIIQKWK